MNIGITGASGFVGQSVVDLALRRGHSVIAFSRHPEKTIPGCEMRRISREAPPDLTGCEAVIHLAGENVAGLWTQEKKRRILESRVQGTRAVVEAIRSASSPPEVLVCSSGISVYGDGGDRELTEVSPKGAGFLADVVEAWEAEAAKAQPIARVATLRTSLVLGRRGGALAAMLPPFRLGLGGRLGSGKQWMPWIHLADHAMLTLYAVENQEVCGPVNAAAPWPVRNSEFTKTLAATLRRPAWFAVPGFALRLLLDGFADEVLQSRRVLPAKATELGFQFKFAELKEALKDLVG
jgi:hypothetical protein